MFLRAANTGAHDPSHFRQCSQVAPAPPRNLYFLLPNFFARSSASLSNLSACRFIFLVIFAPQARPGHLGSPRLGRPSADSTPYFFLSLKSAPLLLRVGCGGLIARRRLQFELFARQPPPISDILEKRSRSSCSNSSMDLVRPGTPPLFLGLRCGRLG